MQRQVRQDRSTWGILGLLAGLMVAACGGGTTGPAGFRDPFATVFVQPFFAVDSIPNGFVDPTVYNLITTHAVADPGNPDPGSVPPSETYFVRNGACVQVFNGNNSRDVRMHFYVTLVRVQYNGFVVDNVLQLDTLARYQSDLLDVSPDVLPFVAPWGLDQVHPISYGLRVSEASFQPPETLPFVADTVVLRTSTDINEACTHLF